MTLVRSSIRSTTCHWSKLWFNKSAFCWKEITLQSFFQWNPRPSTCPHQHHCSYTNKHFSGPSGPGTAAGAKTWTATHGWTFILALMGGWTNGQLHLRTAVAWNSWRLQCHFQLERFNSFASASVLFHTSHCFVSPRFLSALVDSRVDHVAMGTTPPHPTPLFPLQQCDEYSRLHLLFPIFSLILSLPLCLFLSSFGVFRCGTKDNKLNKNNLAVMFVFNKYYFFVLSRSFKWDQSQFHAQTVSEYTKWL